MIQPVTAALSAVASPKANLWYSVSGEMGLSNYLNARQWMGIMSEARSALKQRPWKVRPAGVFSDCVAFAS